MRSQHCRSIEPYWTARPSCCGPTISSDFDGLRSRQGQAEAVLVADDLMQLDGQDLRPEALEERRKRLARLLSRSNKAMREGANSARRSPWMAPQSSATRAA